MRAGLAPAVTGATVTGVTVFDERSLRRHGAPSEDFVDRLTGSRFDPPRRRGKFLWLPVDSGRDGVGQGGTGRNGTDRDNAEALVVHLGMSGQVLLRDPDAPLDRLTRIGIDIRHPELGALRIDFVDQRIFGSMALDRLVETADVAGDLVPSQVLHIARDPLDADFDDDRFLAAAGRASNAHCSTRRSSAASATSTRMRRSGRRGCTTTSRPGASRGRGRDPFSPRFGSCSVGPSPRAEPVSTRSIST